MTQAIIPHRPLNLEPEDISKIVADFDAVMAVINGQIGSDNFIAGQIFAPSKITNEGSPTAGRSLQWDGAKYIPYPHGILCAQRYAPASNVSLSTTTTTPNWMDNTNIRADFWAPHSGQVIIEMRIWISTSVTFYVFPHDGTVAWGPWESAGVGSNMQGFNHLFWKVVGLPPGAQKAIYFQWANFAAGTTTALIGDSGSSTKNPPLWIIVHDVGT